MSKASYQTGEGRKARIHRYRLQGWLTALVPGVVTVLILFSQSVEATGSVTGMLRLKTRYMNATCLFTRNGADVSGTIEVRMPVIAGAAVRGSAEWSGDVVRLNLGLRCPVPPVSGVHIMMAITPQKQDSMAGSNVIASGKITGGKPGPDLLLVDTGHSNTPVTFSPGLALPGDTCAGNVSAGGGDCIEMTGTPQDYRIPLGIRMFFPASGRSDFTRNDMLSPGAWEAMVTLNITYQ